MKALIAAGSPDCLVAFADVPEPEPAADEAVVAVSAYSVNRGEVFLLERPEQGWRPGKDIAGTVVRAAADGTDRVKEPGLLRIHPRLAGRSGSPCQPPRLPSCQKRWTRRWLPRCRSLD
jgi:NADPH2:quinone reductase